MLITDKYAFGHIPKTGGHYLALLLAKNGYKFQHCPFTIENGKIINSTSEKHKPWSEFQPLLGGKKCLLPIRRLDSWWKSYLWHQSIHTKINGHGNVEKITERSYTRSSRSGFMLLPNITCETTYPDTLLQQWYKQISVFKCIRLENLIEDLALNGIQLKDTKVSTSNSYKPPTKYWTEETKARLYELNPLWAGLEQRVYMSA